MILYYLITALHVVVCIILILVVLLQSGKGADLAGAFGGAATQTAFGSRGPVSFLSKLTTISAVIFMLTSLTLTLIGGKVSEKSILDTTGTKSSAPVSKAPVSKPAAAPVMSPEEIRKKQEEIEKKQAQPAASPAPATKGEEKKSAPAPNTKPPEGAQKP